MNHVKVKQVDDLLLHSSTPKLIETSIIDYIMSLRNDGVSYATIKFLIAPIFTYYQLNDILLNRKKCCRYLGEFKRVVKDHAYTTEQIQQMLQNADQRMRMMILILNSTACRVGALPDLTLGNLTKKPDVGIYKITFYEGTNNEYYTFTTREAAQTGIEPYLEFRIRCGEKISFNENTQQWTPTDTPLIRQQFDIKDTLQARNPQPITIHALRVALAGHMVKCGLRSYEHPIIPKSPNRIRKSIPLFNGFRKRAISLFIEAELNHEIRELISDHDTHLDQNYFRPTEDQVLREYLKSEQFLTIDPTVRLSQENQTLTMDRNKLESRLERLEQACKDFM
jgi:site-specific recombinase XerD